MLCCVYTERIANANEILKEAVLEGSGKCFFTSFFLPHVSHFFFYLLAWRPGGICQWGAPRHLYFCTFFVSQNKKIVICQVDKVEKKLLLV